MPPSSGFIILGASGMLGVSWQQALQGFPERWRAHGRTECDIALESSVAAAIIPADKGCVVVNCAAYTNVDGAESDEAAATRLNADAVRVLARRCRDVGATLMHYSTDYVFDGVAPLGATGPRAGQSRGYPTDYPRNPINAYGRSKLAGELALEAMAHEGWADWLCLRTSWLYAAHARNFVLTIAGAARTKPTLRIVDDQRGRPTSCDTLVAISRRMLGAGARGMHHACDGGDCTWFGLGSAVVDRVNADRRAKHEPESALCRVEPCTTAEFPRPARRPAYSVLDLSRTEALIGPIPDWRVALGKVMDRVLAPPTP